VELSIRPKRRRHRQPAVLLAAVLGLFLLCGGLKVIDRASAGRLTIQVWQLTLLLVMCLLPALGLGILTTLNIRNVRLRTENGTLISTEWTGRTVRLVPRSASVYPLGSYWGNINGLLVLAEKAGGRAIVLAPWWWREEELEELLRLFHLTTHTHPPGGLREIPRRYPGTRLPFSVRRPWLFSGGGTALALGYLFAMVYLDLHF